MSGPQRNCLACGQIDDHPRCQVVLEDGSSAYWHMDCHARVTGCQACTDTIESAGELKGDDLRSHIVANDPAGVAQAARVTTEG